MTTSNSIDFNPNRDALLKGALRLVGRAGRGKTPSSADMSDAAEAFNLFVKALQGTGAKLWKVQAATLFVTKGMASYSLTGSHCTQSYVSTKMKTAGAASDSTIDVDSITGITSGDYVGVELDDGTMQWTTISGVPTGDTVPLTTSLTSASAVDNTVYTYTTQLLRPLKAIAARRINVNDVDIDVISRDEYFRLPTKTASGQVNQVYYDPQLGTSKLYIWPTGSQPDDRVEIDFMMPIEDLDSSTDTADFPQEWLLAIKFGIASLLGPEKGLKLDRQLYLDSRATAYLENVMGFDEEYASVYFQVES